MYGQMHNDWQEGRMDGWIKGCWVMERGMDDGLMDGCIDGSCMKDSWMDGRMTVDNGWKDDKVKSNDGWMEIDRMDGWMESWMDDDGIQEECMMKNN